MKLLSYSKNETGWTLNLDTEKKPFPRKGKAESIKQSEFFPMIPLLGDGFPPTPGERKVYGSIIVRGTMSFLPITQTMKKRNSLHWALWMKEEESIVGRGESQWIPRQKTPMDLAFDKEYVFDGKQWVPMLVWNYLNDLKADATLDSQDLFHKVMGLADKDVDAIQTVLDAFRTDVKALNMPNSLKIRTKVPIEVAERASTFHYGHEAKRDFNPYNGQSFSKTRKLSELIPEEKYMNPLQLAMAKRLGLIAA